MARQDRPVISAAMIVGPEPLNQIIQEPMPATLAE
jgi:hypothetical protein